MSDTRNIQFVRMGKHDLPTPSRSTHGSAGYDLMSREEVTIWPGQRQLIKVGFGVKMPEGVCAQVCPRSGMAYKRGITVLNSPGVVDSDYREEVGVILVNHGDSEYHVDVGDRIAQLVFMNYFLSSEDHAMAARNGGFGSTGV